MKLIIKPLKCSYFLITLMAVAFSACRGPEAKENVLVSSLSNDSIHSNPIVKKDVAVPPVDIILQSNDGGLTWLDISESLPEQKYPDSFFAVESDLYLSVNRELYHSKGNLI